jgi:hypothetical protein
MHNAPLSSGSCAGDCIPWADINLPSLASCCQREHFSWYETVTPGRALAVVSENTYAGECLRGGISMNLFNPNKGTIREVGRVNAGIDRQNDNYRKGCQEQLRVPAYHLTSVTPQLSTRRDECALLLRLYLCGGASCTMEVRPMDKTAAELRAELVAKGDIAQFQARVTLESEDSKVTLLMSLLAYEFDPIRMGNNPIEWLRR